VTTRPSARAVILLYHRVAQTRSDPWALAVTPRHFEEQLAVLRSRGAVLSLQELWETAVHGRAVDRTVAVTFDDGYFDVLGTAKPLLEEYEITATVFVPTGMMGRCREFWWDELERVILQSPTLPDKLSVTTGGREYRWELGGAARFSGDSHPGWRAWGQPDPTARHRLYRSLYELLYGLQEAERLSLQDKLLAWAGVASVPEKAERRVLSEDELVKLSGGSLITIGAHSVTHSLLAVAPIDTQRREIMQSKSHLENVLGRSITSFAYPFGKRGDYTDETVALVREAGFSCACANIPGNVTPGSDRFQLPRIYVFDWDGDKFARQLSSWLDD
jgi:peptidoglycan/xylan/chitin deacetylase (PgdA/CDA1 family)